MILLKSMQEHQEVLFPKNYNDEDNRFILSFRSELTNAEFGIEVYDLGNFTDFYLFNIDTVGLAFENGEYIYEIHCKVDNALRGKGLLRIGDFKHTTNKYDEEIKYKQYEY